MGEQVEVTELPKCDFCTTSGHDNPATVDAKTRFGPWANMCDMHWRQHGAYPTLGTGKGQRLIVRSEAR